MLTDVLAIRALNACRLRHKPTYVALRAMLAADEDSGRSRRLVSAAQRKASVAREWRYFKFPVLKELEGGKKPFYRDCSIGSPFTLLAEAAVLLAMSKEEAFAPPSNVYSYWWPRNRSAGLNYCFYRQGYTTRNQRIGALLNQNPSYVAVVNDIKQFYPSVNWDDLQPRIDRRLEKVPSPETRRTIRAFIGAFRSASKRGIAVGPDISHVLANIALEDVDAIMASDWGEQYFRYVDDVIVVCERGDVKRVQGQLEAAVTAAGLALHVGKQDIVKAVTWGKECPSMPRHPQPGTFEELMRDLQLYMLLKPGIANKARDYFAGAGFSLPIDRIVTNVQSKTLRQYATRFFSQKTWSLWWNGLPGLLQKATNVREMLLNELRALQHGEGAGSGMRRRWFVQKMRYRINRLLYLLNRDRYGDFIEMIPSGDEFAEYRVLISALRDANVTGILGLPGPVVGTFCELMADHRNEVAPPQWSSLRGRAAAESAAQLVLYFGWKVPEEAKDEMYPGYHLLLDIVGGAIEDRSTIIGQSFINEIDLLLRDVPREVRERYAKTRLSAQEIMGLEGLGLGGDYLS